MLTIEIPYNILVLVLVLCFLLPLLAIFCTLVYLTFQQCRRQPEQNEEATTPRVEASRDLAVSANYVPLLLLYLEILSRLSSLAMKNKSKVLEVENPIQRLDCIIRGKVDPNHFRGEQKCDIRFIASNYINF
ncbi:uncharacterized protein LOC122247503 [Penaeus japonicus]|uniref:uncharacterized protein LOC122247503 n=1 Tax=Penaeus japonicus TaxID=27405 RepID=UPI001C712760|nr:uncharacterized protein LOC122247503 [Penaeus japonicus]